MLSLSTSVACGEDLAKDVQSILQRYCHECHGARRESDPNFDVLNHDYMIRPIGTLIVPGNSQKSRVMDRIKSGEMPPDGRQGLTEPEVVILDRWINSGAKSWSEGNRKPISIKYTSAVMGQDVLKSGFKESRTYRYFFLTHLYNAGVSEKELEVTRAAVAKTINSLSTTKGIKLPVVLDRLKLVLRINLKDYAWTDREWDMLRSFYPYSGDPTALRADWFVVSALQAPLYYELLGLPQTELAFEKGLRIDAKKLFADGSTKRAGIMDSGISDFHRIAEHNQTPFGSYWKTINRRSEWDVLKEFETTEYDYSESTFTLPNGMPAWIVFLKGGERINAAPGVDRNKTTGDHTIIPALSCVACHSHWMQPNVRDAISASFSPVPKNYPGQEKFNNLILRDKRKYTELVAEHKLRTDIFEEPVKIVAQRFYRPLDLPTAAAEAGCDSNTLGELIKDTKELQTLGLRPLPSGRTVSRDAWQSPQRGVIPAVRVRELVGGNP